MFTKDETVTLANLGGGAALELFNAELEKVLENITDPNTDPKAVRSITLKVTIKPDETRDLGDVGIQATSNLAGSRAYVTRLIFGRNQKGGAEAREFETQRTMFDEKQTDETDNDKVTHINGG